MSRAASERDRKGSRERKKKKKKERGGSGPRGVTDRQSPEGGI